MKISTPRMHAPRVGFGALWIAFAILCVPIKAQDQVEIVDDAPLVLNWAGTLINPRALTYAQAKQLVITTLQARDTPATAYVDDPDFYCLIHLVLWKQPDRTSTKPEVDFKRWYVFRGGSKWDQVKLEGARIYGSHKVAVMAVHWSPSVEIPTAADLTDKVKAMPGNDTDAKVQATVQTLLSELNHGPITRFTNGTENVLIPFDGFPFVKGYPPVTPLTYRVEVTSKLAAPWAHLLQLVAAVSQSGGKIALKSILRPIWTGRLLNIQYVPSDIVVRMLFDQTLTEMDNQSFDDEGTYQFDFSAGIPLRSIKQLQYDTSGGTATPKVVDKYTVFGMFNYFFKPTDIKTDYQVANPSLIVGFGLTGRPWERPMIGMGLGYRKLSGFIGANWNRVSDPVAAGSVTTLHKRWDPHPKLVFGVNITAKQLAGFLKPKK